MCGIDLIVGATINTIEQQQRTDFISRRGPDSYHTITTPSLLLTGSVLHLRGSTCVEQPVDIGDGCYFCWNGELYSDDDDQDDSGSDTLIVAQLITNALNESKIFNNKQQQHQHLADALSTLQNAEYSMVLTTQDAIYYARDIFGRRSLLSFQDETTFRLSSVGTSTDWIEVPPGKLFCFPLLPNYETVLTERDIVLQAPLLCLVPTIPQPPRPPDCSETMWQASIHLEYLLKQAVERRLVCSCHPSDQPIGILFSGGIDSVVLAAMVCASANTKNRAVELYNISFGQKSKDRLAALASYENLKELYPDTNLCLYCVDKTWDDIQSIEHRIQVLLYPKASVMDMNIGCALWFAAGAGTSGGRILLVGMGADEQLGGYTRHCVAAKKGTLRQELEYDMNRLWERNLGRDDRLLSDHGKEGRFPFLDCNVVHFLKQLPVEDICDFSLPPGQGDKRILRMVARRNGLVACSALVKRAIQFGSRISHVSDAQRFGSRRQAKGEKRYDVGKKERDGGQRVTVHGDGTVVVHDSK